MNVTGQTRIFGILADPIHHVKTPGLFNALAAEEGVDAVMVPIHVRPEGLAAMVEGLRRMENFGGFIATVPLKTAMLALCDEVTGAAREIGAVNAVRREPDGRMVGAMLDGIGFIEGLRAAGVEPRGMRAYLAGAGGAASAIAFALAEAGVARLTIANRTEARARALCDRIAASHPGLALSTAAAEVAGQDLVVNATSLGMAAGDAPPLDFGQIHAGQVVADAIMQPVMTPLLVAAESAGARIQPGLPMLASQIRLMARHMGAIG